MISQLAVVLASLSSLTTCFAHVKAPVIHSSVINRLRTEAMNDWRAEAQAFQSIDVTFRKSNREGPSDKMAANPDQTIRFAYDPSRNLKLLRTQKLDAERVFYDLRNPDYRFEVCIPTAKSKSILSRIRTSQPLEDKQFSDTEPPSMSLYLWYLQASFRMFGTPLEQLLDPKEFRVLEAVKFDEFGNERIRLSAEFNSLENAGLVQHGVYTVIFDPAHRYRPIACRVELPNKSYKTLNISYFESDDLHIPREVSYTSVEGSFRSEQIFTYETPEPCTLSDAEFYLPHYGISEDVLDTLKSHQVLRWTFINGGVASICAGAVLVRRRTRHSVCS